MRWRMGKIEAPDDSPVTMLELFFDLVFVFVLTQLTALITGPDGWVGYARAGLVLTVTWWMYNGYAWLANNVPPTTASTRLPMLAAMTCFLAMAAVLPDAFGGGAWIFAVAYTAVVTIHAVQFSRSAMGDSARAIRRVLPANYGVSGLLLLGAALGPRLGWVAWLAAVGLLLFSLARRQESGFALRSEHFAERHRLVVILALGETIIVTGVSVQDRLTEPAVLIAFIMAMVLISALWWVYFGVGDDEKGLAALSLTDPGRLSRLSSRAYSATHLVHVAGLVLVAAWLHPIVADPRHLTTAEAATGPAGVAAFLAAQAAFRRTLRIGPAQAHLAAAGLAAALAPVTALTCGAVQLLGLACVVCGLAAALSVRRLGARR
jgi:low temperature requirement protein LtrA